MHEWYSGTVHLSACVALILLQCGVLHCNGWISSLPWNAPSPGRSIWWACDDDKEASSQRHSYVPNFHHSWRVQGSGNVAISLLMLSFVFFYFLSLCLLSSVPSRLCLDLFEEVPPAIQSELNLIASLSLLDDFGVSILPVQVRLCENKLDIIRNVLDASHSAYKQHEKVEMLLSTDNSCLSG